MKMKFEEKHRRYLLNLVKKDIIKNGLQYSTKNLSTAYDVERLLKKEWGEGVKDIFNVIKSYQSTFPQMRLGQIISICLNEKDDLFYLSDSELLEKLKKLKNKRILHMKPISNLNKGE